MSNNNNNTIIILVLVALSVIAAVFLIKPSSQEPQSEANTTPQENDVMNETWSTIGSEWQWSKNSKSANTPKNNDTSLPFTAESVYRALQAVKLDQDGNVILDHDALLSLDETLERIHNRLDNESLNILQELIKNALPGKAGEQTAELVADYYHFLGAKQEFSQINEAMADSNDEMSMDSIKANEALYGELQELRKAHIGSEQTSKLFRVSDANAQYMFESMKLESNSSLTDEEKQQRHQEIKEKHTSLAININDWPQRYHAFKQEKQAIIESSLSPQQKQQKLAGLLSQSFDSDEIKRIDHLNLDKL